MSNTQNPAPDWDDEIEWQQQPGSGQLFPGGYQQAPSSAAPQYGPGYQQPASPYPQAPWQGPRRPPIQTYLVPHQATFARSMRRRSRSSQRASLSSPNLAGGESDDIEPALTPAPTRVKDDLVSAGTQRGVASMPTYVSLIHWTDQGIKNYKDTTSRAQDFSKLIESLGGNVRELLWTVGEYDIVAVTELPDDEAGTAALLRLGSLGNVRTSTMRAFTADEMGNIIRRTG